MTTRNLIVTLVLLSGTSVVGSTVGASPVRAVDCFGVDIPPGGLLGTNGNDLIQGAGGMDEIHGLGGHDQLSGANESDRVCGGDGVDLVTGDRKWVDGQWVNQDTGALDRVRGGDNCDSIAGDKGDDLIYGDADNDYPSIGFGGCTAAGGPASGNGGLYGGDGDDFLSGGAGVDYLVGNLGSDDKADGGPGFDTCHSTIERTSEPCEDWV